MLLDEAVDPLTLLGFRLAVQHLEHLFEPVDLPLGLLAVGFERLDDLLVLGLLGERGQRVEELVLRVVHVFEVVHEQLVEGG